MIGERIQQARKAAGLSLRALGEKAGVTAMAISKYENNQSTPSSDVLLALAKALNVRTEYFFRQASIELENVEHREHGDLPKKEEVKVLADVREQLERWAELEKVLPAPWSKPFSLPKGLPKKVKGFDEIEEVAIAIRKHWNLGLNPISDLIDTIETKGIKVLITQYDEHEKFNGLSATVNGAPVVVVGKHWTGDRQRFTLAHELGHLVLSNLLDKHLKSEEEKACDRFAGAFLAPKDSVIECLGVRRKRLELQELCLLKHDWGLSMMAWTFRAKDLNVIPYTAYKQLWKEHLGDWKKNKKEPGEIYEAEKPRLFEQLIFRAIAEEQIGESKAAELLSISVTEFHAKRKLELEDAVVNQ